MGRGLPLVLVSSLACESHVTEDTPRLDSIEPTAVANDTDASLTLRGSNFSLALRSVRGRLVADAAFEVELGGVVPLHEVTWHDSTTITARLPAGVPEGQYDVVLRDPRGHAASLLRALEVYTPNCADSSTCADSSPCTANERCEGRRCVWDAVLLDADGDGSVDAACGGDDCDDALEDVHPGATDAIADGVDQDCDGGDRCWLDADGDGFGGPDAVADDDLDCDNGSSATASLGGDCDDSPSQCGADCRPGSSDPDRCDGRDNDCDGTLDEDHTVVLTSCGRGACAASGSTACVSGEVRDSCLPGTPALDDTDCDGVDDDCNGADDDGYLPVTACGVGVCRATSTPSSCDGGVETPCAPGAPSPSDADCDGEDDDCSGQSDEDYQPVSACGSGICRATSAPSSCSGGVETPCLPGPAGVEGPPTDPSCSNGQDDDCDGVTDASDPGCSGINTAPSASLFLTPRAGDTTTLFTASGDGTVDLEQSAASLTYEWDWDGDGIFEAGGSPSTRTFGAAGDYRVVLRVTDGGGLSDYAAARFVVAATPVIRVTTLVDENSNPGSGLSLREAIAQATATAGHQTILVPPGTIQLTGNQAGFNDASGVTVVAYGTVLDGASGAVDRCLQMDSGNNAVYGIEIHGCGLVALFLGTGANRVYDAYLHDSVGGLFVGGAGATVTDSTIADIADYGVEVSATVTLLGNVIRNVGSDCIQLGALADASIIAGNVLHACGTEGIHVTSNSNDHAFVNNTLHGSGSHGIFSAVNVSGLIFRNNSLTSNNGWGAWVSDANLVTSSHNAYFGNLSGACRSCALGAGSLAVDPLYLNAGTGDFRLAAGSPLIDAGFDAGFDRNGDVPGSFNGAAPDIGARETP